MRWLVLLCALFFAVAGCGTPAAVKKLSQEQVNSQKVFHDSLKIYMQSVANFADAQVNLANKLIDENTQQIADAFEKKTKKKILAKPQDEPELNSSLDEFSKNLIADFKIAHDQKFQIKQLVDDLKQVNARILLHFNGIMEAQTKLNDYIQLEKAEEAIVNDLLGKMGLNTEGLSNSVNEAVTISEKIKSLLKNLKP